MSDSICVQMLGTLPARCRHIRCKSLKSESILEVVFWEYCFCFLMQFIFNRYDHLHLHLCSCKQIIVVRHQDPKCKVQLTRHGCCLAGIWNPQADTAKLGHGPLYSVNCIGDTHRDGTVGRLNWCWGDWLYMGLLNASQVLVTRLIKPCKLGVFFLRKPT